MRLSKTNNVVRWPYVHHVAYNNAAALPSETGIDEGASQLPPAEPQTVNHAEAATNLTAAAEPVVRLCMRMLT